MSHTIEMNKLSAEYELAVDWFCIAQKNSFLNCFLNAPRSMISI